MVESTESVLLDKLDACLCNSGFAEGNDDNDPETPCRYNEEDVESFSNLNPMLFPAGDREEELGESDERDC